MIKQIKQMRTRLKTGRGKEEDLFLKIAIMSSAETTQGGSLVHS